MKLEASRGRRLGLAVIAMGLMLAMGCGQESPSESPGEPQSPYAGLEAEAFTLETYEGESHSLSDYRGRVVVLNFWYST